MANEQFMQKIETLMAAERWDEALAAAEVKLAEQPQDPELLWVAGWASLQLEQYARAEPYLHKAAELGPVDHFRYWAFGLSLLELGNYAAAELWLLRALAIRDSYRARIALALAYHKQGLIEVAEAVHREGVRLQPKHRDRMEAYADFLSDIGREEDASRMYEEAKGLPVDKE